MEDRPDRAGVGCAGDASMRVYDCFMLYNEADVLEVRLGELYDHVDVFVVVEATTTFAGRPKPQCYRYDDPRWAPFRDKVRLVIVHDLPTFTGAPVGSRWFAEIMQRNAILRGLEDAAYEDVVIVSDADEIPRGTSVDDAKALLKQSSRERSRLRVKFQLEAYQGDATRIELMLGQWCAPSAVTLQTMINIRAMPNDIRHASDEKMRTRTLENAGRHFCFCGGETTVSDKLDNYSHDEFDQIPLDVIRERLHGDGDIFERAAVGIRRVALGDRHPRYLVENRERLSALTGGDA